MRTRLARLLIAACLLLALSAAAADVRPRPAPETAPEPPPVIGAGQSANITHLANVVDSQYNAGISYRSPRGKFYAHLKTNYQAARPTANVLTTGPSNQNNPRQEKYQFWDMETSYRLTEKLRLTCTARNLGSERPEATEIGMVTGRQQATGIQWIFGANDDL